MVGNNPHQLLQKSGIDRETGRLLGSVIHLELEADPSALGLHAEAVLFLVERGPPGNS